MRTFRLTILLVVGLALLGLLATTTLSRPVEAQGSNLLQNPGFEAGVYTFDPDDFTWVALYPSQREDCKNNQGVYLPCGTANAPLSWIPWWISQQPSDPDWKNRMPEYKPARPPFVDRIRSGVEAAQYFSFQGTHTAGLLQVVTVPANAQLRFSIWGQAWSTIDDSTFSNQPTTVNLRIGIDPTGGTNPYSPAIVWSDYQQPYDFYSLFVVEAQAQGDKVTVFTISSPDEQRKHNDVYWDDAELVVIGEGVAVPPPPAGGGTGGDTGGGAVVAPPSPGQPTSTPNAEGVIYAAVVSGDSWWSLAARNGLTLDEIYELNNANQGTVLNVGDLVIVGYGTPAGEEEPAAPAAEGGAEEPTATPLPEPTALPTATPQTTGTLCLAAFEDSNKNGQQDAGEAMRAAVAFTVSDAEKVVTNYVTDGVSEPYCVKGLPAGNYRITRSVAANESLTTTGDWAVAVAAGSEAIFMFGSYTNDAAPAGEEIAAVDTGTAATPAADNNTTEAAATESDSGSSLGRILVIAVVIVAVLLLLGVGVLFASSRRATV